MNKNPQQHILFDHERSTRIGLPEAVFCQGKDASSLKKLLLQFNKKSGMSILFTRLDAEFFYSLEQELQDSLDYDALSRTAFAYPLKAHTSGKKVAIVSAGTADARVAHEAARTLAYLGIEYALFEDCGVAGLWRLLDKINLIKEYDIVITVAGLDAALASVMGGLVSAPIIAVPTSVGYGMAREGESALCSMLSSCAQGISVMNIDNGYGAACAAARIINLFRNH